MSSTFIMHVGRIMILGCIFSTTHAVSISSSGLRVEVFGNSVMRGTPRCTVTAPNGFNQTLAGICGKNEIVPLQSVPVADLPVGVPSLRITGTLTVDSGSIEQWYKFGLLVNPDAWVRLWIDDHRIVDAWSGPRNGPTAESPVTPGLLPNVTLSPARAVTIRIDVRPWSTQTTLNLQWSTEIGAALMSIPSNRLSPMVPVPEQNRRALQERASTGWGQFARGSNLAQITLPQQTGIDLGILDQTTGTEFRHALLNPQFGKPTRPPVPVRMGRHGYDGSYAQLSFVPFPLGTSGVAPVSVVNVSVESAAVNGDGDNYIVLSTNLTTTAAAAAANLSIVVHPATFWGATANISQTGSTLVLDSGELGVVTVSFSQPPQVYSGPGRCDQCVVLALTASPIVMRMSFTGEHDVTIAQGMTAVATGAATVDAVIASAAKTVGGDVDAYDAMMTAIAWNVNFDPRVAITAPVSRTFESGFDFIFFDWDMYFLSLMAGTSPAADNSKAFDIAISNLIEVTQTRSAYGQVMNKRAANGASTSDTNDRTEPYVGSLVVKRIFDDAKGTPRQSTLDWVNELLFPTLLRWNQWAWENRRYNITDIDGGLFVLGSDNNAPCEGSTVGLNNSRTVCGGFNAAVLEAGMDNSPMYFNAFNQSRASYDGVANKLQLFDVQMSSLFVSESRNLQALASNIAGTTPVVAQLKAQADSTAVLLNKVLWDNATGIYRQVDASPMKQGFSSAISPTSFYPMLGGVASADQVERLVRDHLTNASEFCVDPGEAFGEATCPFALPSISRSDPNFYDNSYWAGRTWGPLNLLTWLCLSNEQYATIPRVEAARKGLVAQSRRLLMVEWMEKRHVHENYNSTNGRGCDVVNSNPFYHWGANLVYIGMRETLESQKH
eukprot:m.136415 g.136415  ORF g.136415 m.136415 type:complete len:891 (+) comp29849_c1_seq1:147-2819(+)